MLEKIMELSQLFPASFLWTFSHSLIHLLSISGREFPMVSKVNILHFDDSNYKGNKTIN